MGGCTCGTIRTRSSKNEHVITRTSCCTTSRSGVAAKEPQLAASVAEETVQVIFCPPEAPFKTFYRSSSGSVSCGEER